jgi:hypothetical protein
MALDNNTFTAVTGTDTRDLSADIGANYNLDGNATDGRLNVATGAKVIFGNSTSLVLQGSPGSDFMLGIIEGKALTMSITPNGGRYDLLHFNAGLITEDLTLNLLGNGNLYLHLEDDNSRTALTGFTRFNFKRTGGYVYIQFGSKEYQNICLNVLPGSSGTTFVYCARSTAGFTDLPGFKTVGITSSLSIRMGSNATSSLNIIDPIYEGTTNNILSLNAVNSSTSRKLYELFSLDVTAIRHDDAKIRVVSGIYTFNSQLTTDKCTPKDNSGDALNYFSGRNVILCRVREVSGGISNSRNTVNITIRRLGYQDITYKSLSMNNPVIIEEHLVNEAYDTTIDSSTITGISITGTVITISESRTLQELYNYCTYHLNKDANMGTDNFISIKGSLVEIDTYTIKIESTGELNTTDSLNAIKVSSITNLGNLNVNYVKNNGKVDINVSIIGDSAITSKVYGLWLKSQGSLLRTNILTADNNSSIEVEPNTEYLVVADGVGGYRSDIAEINSGNYGVRLSMTLSRIKKSDGVDILPESLTTEQNLIANHWRYNVADNIAEYVLPADYSTDDRWDSVNKIWTAKIEDFIPYAFFIEKLQSSKNFLISPFTIKIDTYELILHQNSLFKVRQAAENTDCTINLKAFSFRQEGDNNSKTTFIDNSNGFITVNSKSAIIVSGGTSIANNNNNNNNGNGFLI